MSIVGKNTAGDSQDLCYGPDRTAARVVLAEAGYVTKLWWRLAPYFGGTATVEFAVYGPASTLGTNTPLAFVADGSVGPAGAEEWYSRDCGQVLQAGTYWLTCNADDYLFYISATEGGTSGHSVGATGMANPWGSAVSAGSRAYSAYMEYTPLPSVTSVDPGHGAAAGGTSVTITGDNFTGATAVKFGADDAESFDVEEDEEISAVSPAHVTGAVHVTVTTAAGTSDTGDDDLFTYFDTAPYVADHELTDTQLYDLIHRAQPIGGKFVCELLDDAGNVVRELQALDGTVYYDATQPVTRWLKIQLLEELDWASRPRIRVYQILWGRLGGQTLRKRVDRGVYIIKGIPVYRTQQTPPVFDCDAFGLETILQRFVADAHVEAAGTGYTAALAAVIAAAGWTGRQVISTTVEQELMANAEPLCWWWDTSLRWCGVASDICAEIGLVDLYVDESGVLRTQPAKTIAESPVDWHLDTTDRATNIVREALIEMDEFDGETNWRRYLNTNDAGRTGLTPTEGDGLLTIDDSAGGTTFKRPYEKSCADQTTFEAECARDYADELARKRRLKLKTTALPAVRHQMVVVANVPEAGGARKARVVYAEIPLKIRGTNATLILDMEGS